MANPLEAKTKEQIAGDLIRIIVINSDLTDVAPGSTLATLVEAIASIEFQIQMSVLKVLEASNVESLVGVNLDKKAISLGLPDTVGGQGRSPSSPAGGPIIIGSGFKKISSKPYAGKPAPFAGSRTLYLENASEFPLTGSIYIGRGTPDRFEGPILYTSVTDSGSFWVVELFSPLTKSHPYTDLIVVAQGGDRTVNAGTTVLVPANSNGPSISYTTNASILIPDGEAEGRVQVTASAFGLSGNALAGAIKEFSSEPFLGATVTNPISFQNGRPTENDEELRRRIKNFPSTLARGTRGAIIAALQGARDPDTGRAITSVSLVEPVKSGDSSKVYLDDGTGLEPEFNSQPYELLLSSASGQETKFKTAQVPITAAVAIGSQVGPFALINNQELTIALDGITESYKVTGSNYKNLSSASVYEIVRDFNSQSNIVGFRTINGGTGIAGFDLSGQGEIMQVEAGDLQEIFGFPTAQLRPIFLYKNSRIQSFKGRTATLTTSAYPWSLNLIAGDLSDVRVAVDGVIQTFSIVNSDFAEFGANVSSATLNQWAIVFSRKIAGVKFSVLGNRLIWSTYQVFSPNGTLEILTEKENGASATWIGSGKMWEETASGGILSDSGTEEDFRFNRFSGDIEFLNKPDPNDTIEIGSRTTRAQIESVFASGGLYGLSPLPTLGNAKMVVGFDGVFALREVFAGNSTQFTPTFPDAVNAYNIVRLTANESTLFGNAKVGDYMYLVKDNISVPTWGTKIEGLYILKAVGINGFETNQVYLNIAASTLATSSTVTVTQANHGFKSGAQITVVDATPIGGINLSVTAATITVIDGSTYTYIATAPAVSTDSGVLDSVTYLSDTWVEFEVSTDQRPDWASLVASPQNIKTGQVYIFKSTVQPQVIDFGVVASVTVDNVISIVNSQIAGGEAVKLSAQNFVIRSNDFKSGTAAIFASVGNAESMILASTASSIQAHIAYSTSGHTQGGFPVVSDVVTETAPSAGYGTRSYLYVDKNITNVTDFTTTNPLIEASSNSPDYPVGFQELWLTGRYFNYAARVYNNQTTFPYNGFLRKVNAISPSNTADDRQTSTVGSLDRYAHLGLRLQDIPLTEHDRLVVQMDLNPTDKTIVVPTYKKALIEDIDTITGNGKGQVISFKLKDPEDLDPLNFYLPRPFFDAQSIYRNFDFSDFKLLTKSIGVYIDPVGANTPARGSLTAIGAAVGSLIEDGDTLTLADGINPAVVFEFDNNAATAPGNIAIPFTNGTPAVGALTAITAIPGLTIEDGDTFTLSDGVNVKIFEFDSDSNVILGREPVIYIAGVAATGTLTSVLADPITGVVDSDIFTLDDGVNPPVVFEFDDNASVNPGNIPVTIATVDTATVVKAAMITAINGVGAGLLITASSGVGNDIILTNDLLGTAGNVAITELLANVTLNPTGMSGGINTPTATAIRTAMITAINAAAPLNVTAAPGAGNTIDLTNDNNGVAGNVSIFQNISNSATLTPVGMSGGTDDPTAAFIKASLISAINTATPLNISAISGFGSLINLTNNVSYTIGNVGISESISNSATLTPVGMSGGTDIATGDKAIVLRSVVYGSPNQLRLSIRYATLPGEADLTVSHFNDFVDEKGRTTILVSLPTQATIVGSAVTSGIYTVHTFPSGNISRLRITAAGLNPSGQYIPDNIFSIEGGGPLAGAYKIIYAEVGSVEVLAPGITGFASPTIFDASINPISSYALDPKTLEDIATAINNYNPDNPVATAEAIGTGLPAYFVTNPTYISYENAIVSPVSTMSGSLSHHSFSCKDAGSAGIWQYDSSVPALNNIKATSQTYDSIFPNAADVVGTTYSPIDEEVFIVPSNSKTLERWANFTAVSSLSVLANIKSINSCDNIQISSKEDGSDGGVFVSGVTANKLESFLIGNGTNDATSTRIKTLYSEAKSLVRGQLVKLENSVASEIRRAYRITPEGNSITVANNINSNNYFRDTNSVKYIKLSANTARIIFYRNGMGSGQVEPLTVGVGNTVTLTSLGSGLVRVTCSVSAGTLSARVGDMAYIRPYGSTPFAADAQCTDLDIDGATTSTDLEYWGYPVVQVEDDRDIVIIAPNITTFGAFTLNSPTDIVFIPAVYNEKNVRTNRAEGADFSTLVNSGNVSVLVKKLGGNMLSIWVQNSATEATDDMLLDIMSVGIDDYVTLDSGFSLTNKGTHRLVAHNGRNHMIVYHAQGGEDEIIDSSTFSGGGTGTRKWAIGPITSPRPIRIVDSDSVRIGDRFRISAPLTTTQWFPSVMIGSHRVIGVGYIGRDYTGDPLPHQSNDGVKDNSLFTQYIDIDLKDSPEFIPDTLGFPVDSFVLAGNVSALGFVEELPYFGYRMVSGVAVNSQIPEQADVFLSPKKNTTKMTSIFGTKVVAQYKSGFDERAFTGIDGYKAYDGLIEQAHKIIDGSPANSVIFPGVRAAGVRIEALPPLIKAVSMSLRVRPKDGVTLNAISDVIKSAVSSYINGLGVGRPVVLSEIIMTVQSLPGVFSVTLIGSLPLAIDDRITVSDIEKAFVLDSNSDITVG